MHHGGDYFARTPASIGVFWDAETFAVHEVQSGSASSTDVRAALTTDLGSAKFVKGIDDMKFECKIHPRTKDDKRKCGMMLYCAGRHDVAERILEGFFSTAAAYRPCSGNRSSLPVGTFQYSPCA